MLLKVVRLLLLVSLQSALPYETHGNTLKVHGKG